MIRLGGTYLAVILVASPARHIAIVGVWALQGTGDTRTPMEINIATNPVNISLSVAFGIGVSPFPRLSIFSVELATAIANTFTAGCILFAFTRPRIDLRFHRPTDWTITRQLVRVAVPQFAEGMFVTLAASGAPASSVRRAEERCLGPHARGNVPDDERVRYRYRGRLRGPRPVLRLDAVTGNVLVRQRRVGRQGLSMMEERGSTSVHS